jgi:hypothetical protein
LLRAISPETGAKLQNKSIMKIQFEVDGVEQIKTLKADSRGRISIGADYAGETVSVAIQSESEPDTQSFKNKGKSPASDDLADGTKGGVADE